MNTKQDLGNAVAHIRELPRSETVLTPLRKGDRVAVRNQSLNGQEVIEGNATIVAVYNAQGRFRVHFDGDAKDETYIRFLQPSDRIAVNVNQPSTPTN